jgi:pimeloyl-ACP methyl ester carboxylesterase
VSWPPPTDFDRLPDGTRIESLTFVSADGAGSTGLLYARGGERTVLCVTHPRADLTRHYLIPSLLESGYAVCGLLHRALTTDYALSHELMLLDIAACLGTLTEQMGFEHVILLANSGGGGIFGLYQWQAETPPPGRLTETPAGDGPDLNQFVLPAADGLVLLATPFGEPAVVMRTIDPSVIDETDPFSCDPDLDMYNPRNGYREPPESSTYADEFASRYLAAQRARIARIDAYARSLIAEQERYRDQLRDRGFARLPADERSYINRRAIDTKPVVVFRGDASLAFCDLSMYPSKRVVGNFGGFDPEATNNARRSPGWFRTPRAWLSNSSGISSRSSLRLALGNIGVPTIIINYTADRGVYPQDAAEMLELSAAGDKELHSVDGEHYGRPVEGMRETNPRATVGRILARWLNSRFATTHERAS